MATQPPQPAAPGGQQVSPEQLRAMQLIVRQAMGVLLQDDTAENIVQRAQAGDPKQVVAETAIGIVKRVWESANSAGAQVDILTCMLAATQIIGTLSEMLAKAGVISEQELPQFAAQACKIAVDLHNGQLQEGGAPAPGAQAQPAPPGGMIGGV